MKARLTLVSTYEYEIVPETYPDGITIEQMLAIDVANSYEDPTFIVERGEPSITAELIEEQS